MDYQASYTHLIKHGMRTFRFRSPVRRNAKIERLALSYNLRQSFHGFFQRRMPIKFVGVKNIYVIQAKAF